MNHVKLTDFKSRTLWSIADAIDKQIAHLKTNPFYPFQKPGEEHNAQEIEELTEFKVQVLHARNIVESEEKIADQ